MKCTFEDCNEEGVEMEGMWGKQCPRHAEDLRRSQAFWTPGRLTLDPMPANEAQLGLAGSRR